MKDVSKTEEKKERFTFTKLTVTGRTDVAKI
jgi:hypothetical protein